MYLTFGSDKDYMLFYVDFVKDQLELLNGRLLMSITDPLTPKCNEDRWKCNGRLQTYERVM